MRWSRIGGCFIRNIIKGIRKAADLPEPVGASAIISRIFRPIGTACIWMGMGLSKRNSCKFLTKSLGISIMSDQFLIGGGHLPPFTEIKLSSLNSRQSRSVRAVCSLATYDFYWLKFLAAVSILDEKCSTPPIDPLPNKRPGCGVGLLKRGMTSLVVSSASSHSSLNSYFYFSVPLLRWSRLCESVT